MKKLRAFLILLISLSVSPLAAVGVAYYVPGTTHSITSVPYLGGTGIHIGTLSFVMSPDPSTNILFDISMQASTDQYRFQDFTTGTTYTGPLVAIVFTNDIPSDSFELKDTGSVLLSVPAPPSDVKIEFYVRFPQQDASGMGKGLTLVRPGQMPSFQLKDFSTVDTPLVPIISGGTINTVQPMNPHLPSGIEDTSGQVAYLLEFIPLPFQFSDAISSYQSVAQGSLYTNISGDDVSVAKGVTVTFNPQEFVFIQQNTGISAPHEIDYDLVFQGANIVPTPTPYTYWWRVPTDQLQRNAGIDVGGNIRIRLTEPSQLDTAGAGTYMSTLTVEFKPVE